MNSLTLVVFLVSLHGVSGWRPIVWETITETPPTKCQPPARFEGKMHGVFKRRTEQGFGTGTIHMDTTTGRGAVLGDFVVYGQVKKMNVYITPSKWYLAIPSIRHCVDEAMDSPVLPENTTKITLQEQGGVPVQVWETDLQEGHKKGRVTIYMTQATCMPVYVDLDITTTGERISATFSAMEEGLEDQSLLDLPSYCTRSTIYYFINRRRFNWGRR